MVSNQASKCSRLILAGAVALAPIVMPAVAHASDLNLDTHLSAAAHGVVGATSVIGQTRLATPAATHADHDNWWIFHNHAHVANPMIAGSFGEGRFSV